MPLFDLITRNREIFFRLVGICNLRYRGLHPPNLYRRVISMHRQINDLEQLINNDKFLNSVYRTLEEFNMNQRGARMESLDTVIESIRFWQEELITLYRYKLYEDLEDYMENIRERLHSIFINLRIMQTQRKIVGVSKTLHFLLPDLILPIDGTYTLLAFFGNNRYTNTVEREFQDFWEIFSLTYEKAHHLNLTPQDVNGEGWNTSIPKLLDNAIIGFFHCEQEERNDIYRN